MNDKHMFEAAKECSKNATYEGSCHVRVGCVIAYKGTILAKGWNTNKTHPMQAHYNKYRFQQKGGHYFPEKCHAEMQALAKIKYLDIDYNDVHVYVYRQFKDGKYAISRPCPACMKAIRSLGINKIHYTTNDGLAFEKLV